MSAGRVGIACGPAPRSSGPQHRHEPRHAGVDDGLHGAVDFLAGERPLGMAEAEAEVDAVLALGHVAAVEGVEKLDRFERRPRGLRARRRPVRTRAASGRRPARGRAPRPGTGAGAGSGGTSTARLDQHAELQLGRGARAAQLQRVEPAAVDLAQVAQVRASERAARRRGRASSRARRPGAPRGPTSACRRLEQGLDTPFRPRKSRPLTRASRVGSSGSSWPGRGR